MLEAHVLSIIVLGVSCFIIGSVPLKIARWTRQPFALSLLLCCGGGVLLATSIVHMLAEVREKLVNYSELYFCGGFFFLYAVDELLHLCVQDLHSEEIKAESRRDSSSSHDDQFAPVCQQHQTSYGTIDKLPKRARFYSLTQSFDPVPRELLLAKPPSSSLSGLHNAESHHCCRSHDKEANFVGAMEKTRRHHNKISPRNSASTDSSQWSSSNLIEQCHIEVKQPCPNKSNSSNVSGLLAALLIHSLLEGCSIGVQTDSSQILLILGAVACHKLVLAFCLGMELATAGYEGFKFILAIIAFSVGCPIGIGIGVSLNSTADSVDLVEAPLQAVSAGSLLYVALFEVLPREKFKWQHRIDKRFATFFQMISVLVGFSSIVLLSILLVGNHGY